MIKAKVEKVEESRLVLTGYEDNGYDCWGKMIIVDIIMLLLMVKKKKLMDIL
jgi:hypothetical protein